MVKSSKREKLKIDVQNTAARLFRLHGIRAVKMDDISSALKISKRTLYEIYDNKHDLLLDVLIKLEEEVRVDIRKHAEDCTNVMDKLIIFFSIRAKFYSETNPKFFADIQKYPEILNRLKQRNEEHHRNSEEFFRQGVEEGYFLDTVNYKFLSRLCNKCMEELHNDEALGAISISEVFHSFICVVIRGFCTPKGIEQLDRFLADLRAKKYI